VVVVVVDLGIDEMIGSDQEAVGGEEVSGHEHSVRLVVLII